MSVDFTKIISSQYIEFNKIYESALHEKRMDKRENCLSLLVIMQDEIVSTAKNAGVLPVKITSADQLSKELSAKIATLFEKDLKGLPTPPPSQTTCLQQCVGFGNTSANCWANVLLQMFLHSPERREVLLTVGKFYATGKNLDTDRIKRVVDHFKEGPISLLRLKEGIALFEAIHSPYAKFQALDALIQAGRPDVCSQLLHYLPQIYRERLAKIQDETDLKKGVTTLLKSEEVAEKRKQTDLRTAGLAFLTTMQSYDIALQTAQINRQLPKAIPSSVSQDMRVAFHLLFGSFNPITHTQVFSKQAGAHEDAYEAMQRVMGLYEEILKSKNTFPPSTYSPIETRRIYVPHGEPRALKPHRDYTTLEPGNISRQREEDYQILLEPPTQDDLLIEALLSKYFRSPALPGSEDGVYLHTDGIHEQSFRLIEEQRRFLKAPKVLTVVIKRFGVRGDGYPYKIQTRVKAHRVITLPAEALPNALPLAFELESFFVHRGTLSFGHYIAYRKIEGKWVELDDGHVRILPDAHIDTILEGRQGASVTPYALDYRLVPEARQEEMLKNAQTQIKLNPAPKEHVPSIYKKLLDLLSKLDNKLKGSSSDREILEVIEALHALSPKCMKKIGDLVGVIEGVKDNNYGVTLMRTHPRKLTTFKKSWIRSSSDNIIGQLIKSEQEKMAIRLCTDELHSLIEMSTSIADLQKDLVSPIAKKQKELEKLKTHYRMENLRAFLALLHDPTVTLEQLRAIFEDLDISAFIKERIYKRIGEIMGATKDLASVGEKHFQADPRVLLTPLKPTIKSPKDLEQEKTLSVLFSDLIIKTSSAPTILEEIIEYASK